MDHVSDLIDSHQPQALINIGSQRFYAVLHRCHYQAKGVATHFKEGFYSFFHASVYKSDKENLLLRILRKAFTQMTFFSRSQCFVARQSIGLEILKEHKNKRSLLLSGVQCTISGNCFFWTTFSFPLSNCTPNIANKAWIWNCETASCDLFFSYSDESGTLAVCAPYA